MPYGSQTEQEDQAEEEEWRQERGMKMTDEVPDKKKESDIPDPNIPSEGATLVTFEKQ